MMTDIHPKLPMRNKAASKDFYVNRLGFKELESAGNGGYLMVEKDHIQIHFFESIGLHPKQTYGQVYIRTRNIEALYQLMLSNKITIHPAGHLERKPWGQREFTILDPDNNSLTFGPHV